MTYKIRGTARYRRAYKRLEKRGWELSLLDEVIELLRTGQKLAPKYRDHALQGHLTGLRECHIKSDWLLVYQIKRDVLILTLIDTGTHAELLGI